MLQRQRERKGTHTHTHTHAIHWLNKGSFLKWIRIKERKKEKKEKGKGRRKTSWFLWVSLELASFTTIATCLSVCLFILLSSLLLWSLISPPACVLNLSFRALAFPRKLSQPQIIPRILCSEKGFFLQTYATTWPPP
jgi:hypothetical protein